MRKSTISSTQPVLPRLLHGRTNMESGIISCHEWGWSIRKIARLFKLPEKRAREILIKYGYLT